MLNFFFMSIVNLKMDFWQKDFDLVSVAEAIFSVFSSEYNAERD